MINLDVEFLFSHYIIPRGSAESQLAKPPASCSIVVEGGAAATVRRGNRSCAAYRTIHDVTASHHIRSSSQLFGWNHRYIDGEQGRMSAYIYIYCMSRK